MNPVFFSATEYRVNPEDLRRAAQAARERGERVEVDYYKGTITGGSEIGDRLDRAGIRHRDRDRGY